MKTIFLFMFMFFSVTVFGQMSEADFFKSVKGKSITGQSVEDVKTTFTFSTDGKTVMLMKNKGYNHTFVKMVGGVAVYKGNRGGKDHYDAFKVDGKTVMVATSEQIGGVKLIPNTPEAIAKALDKKSLKFMFE